MAMTALFNQLLTALQTKIATDIPAFRYIAQDLGQLEIDPDRPPIGWPAVLIDIEAEYEQRQQERQYAKLNFTLTLLFNKHTLTSNLQNATINEAALDYYEMENDIYLQLQNYDAGGLLNVYPMKRMSAVTDKVPGILYRKRIVKFFAAAEDVALMP